MSQIRPTTDVPREPPASVLRPNFGSDKAPSEEVKGMPLNYGEGLLPHVVTFQGIVSTVSRVYRYYDEAMKASMENARFMRNDLMVMEPVEQRRRACALLNWHLEVDDPHNDTEKMLADDLTKIIKRIPQFLKFRECLLDAVWFGKSACQFNWKWKHLRGVSAVNELGQNMVIDHWKPLHGDKVVFRYDDGTQEYDPNQVGIRVGAGYTAGDKGIQGRLNASGRRKVEPTDYGLAYFLEPWERKLLAIHKHMVEDGEYEDPQSAGKIHGLGIRSRIYWTWYMKQEVFAYLLEILERSATGIEIWYYPYGNDEAEAKVKKAAEERIGNSRNIILMPRPVGEDAQAYGVEVVQMQTAGIELLRVLIDEYFGNQIMRYVLGQTMTNKPQSAGLGSDLPQIQLGSYLSIVKYDAINLGETLTTDLVDVVKLQNYPHLVDIPCRFVIDTESEDVESKLEAWGKAYEVGVKTKASDWLRMIGASKPEEDDEIIQNPVIQEQDRLYQQFLQRKQAAEAMGMTPPGAPQPGEEPQAPQQELGGLGEEEPGSESPMDEAPPVSVTGMESQKFAANTGPVPVPGTYGEGNGTIDPSEVVKGTKEEMEEHGLSETEARKIALDHLRERPDYYRVTDKALAETPVQRYMRADGTRWADESIAEGQGEKNYTVPAARWNYSMGGSGGQEKGCSCPAGHCACKIITLEWLETTRSELSALQHENQGRLGTVAGFDAYAVDFDKIKIEPDTAKEKKDDEEHMGVVEGANFRRYSDIVPQGQIWVDARIDQQDRAPILLHEAIETTLMETQTPDGTEAWTYDDAHEVANGIEREYREEHPDKYCSDAEPEQYAMKSSLYSQLLSRYYKASSDEQVESFWAGDEREVVIIQDGRPMRYSRKHGQVSASYVTSITP